MSYTLSEQETFLHRDAETKELVIETNEPTEIRRVLKLAKEGAWTILTKEVEDDRVISVRAKLNEKDYSLNFKPTKRRKMTDEQRKAASERLKRARESK